MTELVLSRCEALMLIAGEGAREERRRRGQGQGQQGRGSTAAGATLHARRRGETRQHAQQRPRQQPRGTLRLHRLTAGMQHFACAAGQEREGPAPQLHGRSARGVFDADDARAGLMRPPAARQRRGQRMAAAAASTPRLLLLRRTLAMWGASASGGVRAQTRCGTPRWRSRERGMQVWHAWPSQRAAQATQTGAAAAGTAPASAPLGVRHVMATR